MRKLGFAVALGALFAGTSAFAQTDGPSIGSEISVFAGSFAYPASRFTDGISVGVLAIPGFAGSPLGVGANSAAFPDADFPGANLPNGNASWNSFVTQHSNGTIEFASSNTVGGNGAVRMGDEPSLEVGILSGSVISFDVFNGAGLGIDSTITPFGFGFYVADVGTGACVLTGACVQVVPFSEFNFDAFVENGGFAEVAFNFQVTSTGDFTTAPPLYSVEASMQINSDGIFEDVDDADLKLPTFDLETPLETVGNPGYHSYGYGWDETAFTANLLDQGFQTVNYTTLAYSYVRNPCYTINTATRCLIAYSGFGDPIGAGDVIAESLGGIGIFNHGTQIQGLNFSTYTIPTPRIVGGRLVVGNNLAVPEPSTWAMMIIGFGAIGALVRRRREQPAHA